MRLMNEILEDGEKAYGSEFLERINTVANRERGNPFKKIHDLVIRPSADLGQLAGQVLVNMRDEHMTSPLLKLAARSLNTPLGQHPRVGPALLPALRRQLPGTAYRPRLRGCTRAGRSAGGVLHRPLTFAEAPLLLIAMSKGDFTGSGSASTRVGVAAVPTGCESRRGAWLVLLVCIAVQSGCDLLQTSFRGALIAPGYALLVLGFTLMIAIPVGLFASLAPHRIATAAGLWVVVEITARAPNLQVGVPLGLGLGAATWFGVRSANPSALDTGVCLAASLWVALVAAGPHFLVLPGPFAVLPEWAAAALLFLATGGALVWRANAQLFGVPIIRLAPTVALAALLAVVAFKHPSAGSLWIPSRSRGLRRRPPESSGSRARYRACGSHVAVRLSARNHARTRALGCESQRGRLSVRVLADELDGYRRISRSSPAPCRRSTRRIAVIEIHVRRPVIDPPETLAERLGGAGFRSAGVVANPNVMSVREHWPRVRPVDARPASVPAVVRG